MTDRMRHLPCGQAVNSNQMSELPASFGTSYFDYMHAEQLQYNRNQASGQEKRFSFLK